MTVPRRARTRAAIGAAVLLGALAGLGPMAGTVQGFSRPPLPVARHFRPVVEPVAYGNRLVTVVAEVAGQPVAAVQASRPAAPLTLREERTIGDQLTRTQAPIASRIRGLGGRVLASYHSAYNGIKVLIRSDRLASVAAIPGVVAVHRMTLAYRDAGVPAAISPTSPGVWGGLARLHGEGLKVAIIDSGIDYTHANFGGPGTPAAYLAARASDDQPADPLLVGPAAPRVKGGIDLVGDSYNADPTAAGFQPIPHPDPNPLDCDGHGSHVAGIAGGSGVLADGTTYGGPDNPAAIAAQSWTIPPGVAPKIDLYAVRIFGCQGPTDAVIDGIDWAVAHHMDVINMSLGSALGSADAPEAVAADNAARAGIIVVASAGNEGGSPYLTSSPASGDGVISVGATDSNAGFAGADITLSGGGVISAIDANGVTLASGTTYTVKVLQDDPASPEDESLGCSVQAFGAVDRHTIAVVKRGTCARAAKAIFGQQAGAGAVVMVNTGPGFPPFEGQITSNPDTGAAFTVTIPFLGVEGPFDDPASPGAALLKSDGQSATLAPTSITNPTYRAIADFSSAGPRVGDSALKPDVAAPGVSIISTGFGTGNAALVESGTSMSSPFVAGVAALVRQAHPGWQAASLWRAAIVNTANPKLVAGYALGTAGTGLVAASAAARTQVVAGSETGTTALNFGYAELRKDFTRALDMRVQNLGPTAVTFIVTTSDKAGSPHTILVAKKLVVPARSTRTLRVTVSVKAMTAGDSSAFNEVGGLVVLTPAADENNGVTLRVPYYLVPRTLSAISTSLDLPVPGTAGTATVTNAGPGPGVADFFVWGLQGGPDARLGSDDLRAAGAASYPDKGLVVFALSTAKRWSIATEDEFDIFVDVNGDGVDDYLVSLVDLGLVSTGTPSGEPAVVVVTLATGSATIALAPDAPFNSSTLELPVLFSQLCDSGQPCASPAHPRIAYHVQSFSNLDATTDTLPGVATFNLYNPAISSGMSELLAPGQSVGESITVDRGELRLSPALGLLVRSADNPAGSAEAQLIPISR